MGDRIKAKMRLEEVEIKGESPDVLKYHLEISKHKVKSVSGEGAIYKN